MTIIDTTNYLDGALRLSRHGAGKGGTVLLHVESGESIVVHPEAEPAVVDILADYTRRGFGADRGDYVFHSVESYHDGYLNSARS